MGPITVEGYVYRAGIYCKPCLLERAIREGWIAPEERGASTENALSRAAERQGIDRHDERSFDSGEFPKTILSTMDASLDPCDECGGRL